MELDPKLLEVLKIEKSNFTQRLNSLIVWALLILHETHTMSHEVFDVLDDWVVSAVKQENMAAQQAVNLIQTQVNQSIEHIDTVYLEDTDVGRSINVIEFQEGPPIYMQEVVPELTLETSRFSLDTLQSIYKQFRFA